MRHLREAVCPKRTELFKKLIMDLHHDNTLSHISLLVGEFLTKTKTVIMSQPPYSSDLAPADFFLFTKLKILRRGKSFTTIEEIKEKSK